MRIACWLPKAANTYSQYVILLFHCNNGCTNAPQCYIYTYIGLCWRRHSSVSVVTRLQGGRAGKRGFDLRQGTYLFTAPHLSDPPSIPSSPLRSGTLWPSANHQELFSYHSPLSCELQNVWISSTSTSIHPHDMVLS
jgi:hypothetical protein